METSCDILHDPLAELRDPATRCGAFDSLTQRFLRPLYWHARRLVVVHEDAEDVVQKTFIGAYDGIESFRGSDEELKAWLYRIATNATLTLLRRRKRRLFTSLDEVKSQLADRGKEADRTLVCFQQALLGLPLKQRLVFNLRYYDQMPYRQIDVSSAAKVTYDGPCTIDSYTENIRRRR